MYSLHYASFLVASAAISLAQLSAHTTAGSASMASSSSNMTASSSAASSSTVNASFPSIPTHPTNASSSGTLATNTTMTATSALSATASTSIKVNAVYPVTAGFPKSSSTSAKPTSTGFSAPSQSLWRNPKQTSSSSLPATKPTTKVSSTSIPTSTVTTSSSAPSPTSTLSAGPNLNSFFVGGNSYYLYALGREDRNAVLDAMQSAGMSVIRIFITHVYENNKNSGNPEVQDLEPNQLGVYDDDILKRIDILMYEAAKRNMKLIIACGDRYALGFWDTDLYATTYGIADQGSTGAQMISDASVFYTSNSAMTHFDKRIDHILAHKNSYMDNKPWSELDDVIYAIEPQNEPMGHMDWASDSWVCDRAGRIKQNLPSNSGILVSSGGGTNIDNSLGDWSFGCGNVDVISVHDYGTDAWSTAATLGSAQQQAWDAGKTLLFEEWGALGDSKADTIQSFAQALQQYGIPWLYWEITKPGQGSSDFEVWTDEPSWDVLSNGDTTGAINWSSKKQKRVTRSSAPDLPEAVNPSAAPRRFRKQIKRHSVQKNLRKTHKLSRQIVLQQPSFA